MIVCRLCFGPGAILIEVGMADLHALVNPLCMQTTSPNKNTDIEQANIKISVWICEVPCQSAT